jgi:hypothetical protein
VNELVVILAFRGNLYHRLIEQGSDESRHGWDRDELADRPTLSWTN